MRITGWGRFIALLIATTGILGSQQAMAKDGQEGSFEDISQHSVLTVPVRANFPLAKRVSIGVGKSLLVQFPFELKDVLVSDPDKVDAVVQTSNRIFLIAKKLGQTNAFFFDSKGQQILTLEISIGADLKSLDGILKRLLPGSNIVADMAGNSAVLTGTVRTPIDSKKAGDIACQFVAANKDVGPSAAASQGANSTSNSFSYKQTSTTQSSDLFRQQTQNQAAACSGDTKLVINMLTIEGEEQVMLKVSISEVQRSLLKQFGFNIGAVVNSGNFTTALLTENALPLTAAAGLGTLPLAGYRHRRAGSHHRHHLRDHRPFVQL
jgi:pilus assembly protein CpaC